jgi:hypothetical protein
LTGPPTADEVVRDLLLLRRMGAVAFDTKGSDARRN